jgi:transposase-like protein
MINKDTRARAMDLFVDYGYSVEKISQEMSLSTATLNNWALKGNWRKLRENKIERRGKFIEELYDFVVSVMKNIRTDYDNGKIDKSALNLLSAILSKAEKLILLETEREKAENERRIEGDIPVEVASQPKVAAAMRVIADAMQIAEKGIKKC